MSITSIALFITIIIALFFIMLCKTDYDKNIDIEVIFFKKFDKLLRKTTIEEKKLYSKIMDKITFSYPENWIVDKYTSDNSYFSIKINNIDIKINKSVKNSIFTSNTKDYECNCIIIFDKNNNGTVLTPPKERFEIYDLFVEYAIWKFEKYEEKQRKEEEKQVSEEHQKTVEKVLKILK